MTDENDQKYKKELAVRTPRQKSPKSVREFINERIGVQARDDAHNILVSKLEEDKQKETDDALKATVVLSSGYVTNRTLG